MNVSKLCYIAVNSVSQRPNAASAQRIAAMSDNRGLTIAPGRPGGSTPQGSALSSCPLSGSVVVEALRRGSATRVDPYAQSRNVSEFSSVRYRPGVSSLGYRNLAGRSQSKSQPANSRRRGCVGEPAIVSGGLRVNRMAPKPRSTDESAW